MHDLTHQNFEHIKMKLRRKIQEIELAAIVS
jgi:hypothetical protein